MSTEEIGFCHEGQIGFIRLKRPQALNALTLSMIKSLQQQLSLWKDDPRIEAVVLIAEGEKAFCAGGDIRFLYEAGKNDPSKQLQFFYEEYRLNHFIHHFPKPYIPLMNGITMGGGVGISLHGSFPVATERFVFAMPETGIGFFPDIGASYLLSRCPGETGLYLGLTGNRISAEEAKYLGLVNYLVPSNQLDRIIEHLINLNLSKNSSQKLQDYFQSFALPQQEKTAIEKNREKIDSCFGATTVEEILAKLKAMKEEWSESVLETLEQKCPLSLKVTLAQIQKAKFLSMAECIKMDYCLVSQFMKDPNFYEGVRALLIDKDKNPQWQPAHLKLLSTAKVVDFFESCDTELSLIS